jgi:carbonic anhydrase
MDKNYSTWKKDLSSSLVVFLVALPLCLGVGLASTTVPGINGLPNIFSGIIAGVIGGVVVGFLSGSRVGVSGPAAGLITIIIAALTTLGSFEGFLVAVIISGILQVLAGFLKLGLLADYFPSAVIKGMLAAIGITLILKEIPHAMGYDKDFIGDEAFFQFDGHNTFSELLYAFNAFQPGSIIISIVSITLLILLEKPFLKKFKLFKLLPGALFIVIIGIGLNQLFSLIHPDLILSGKHLVQLPVPKSINDVVSIFSFPDLSYLSNPNVYIIGGTIALVGSLETLLSVEATDKLDPEKSRTPTNRELKAQGIGNIISGILGGLPVTQVIVRSSANINAGAKSKFSTIMHGFLLMVSVLLIPAVLNMIPLASLAAILIMIGYKLTKVQLFKQLFALGKDQFLPFVATITGVLLTDLLKGIGIGIAVSIFFILRKNFHNNFTVETNNQEQETRIILSEEVTYLNKGSILQSLEGIKENSSVIIDGSRCKAIDYDVLEIIQEFKDFTTREKKIKLKTINIPDVTISGGH